MNELVGARSDELLAVLGKEPDRLVLMYLRANGLWYRFFLDAGLLFLDEVAAVSPDDDLEPGTEYTDFGASYGLKGDVIRELRMSGGVLSVRFASGKNLFLHDSESGTRFIVEA